MMLVAEGHDAMPAFEAFDTAVGNHVPLEM